MKKHQYWKIRNGKIHIIKYGSGDHYLCGLQWEYSDTRIPNPKAEQLGDQLCKKCGKHILSRKAAEVILPNKLFEI